MPPRTISQSPAKTLVYLLGSAVFAAGAAAMLAHPRTPRDTLIGWVGLIFFGLGVAVFAWTLIRPQVLRLDADGFTLDGGFVRAPRRVLWRDIDRFFVRHGPRGVKLVGYNYRPGRAPPSRLAGVARQLGADGGLPKAWPLSPEALVDLLNDYRTANAAPSGVETRAARS